jgi:asparagine synthase (glutamine-hydrolysing)
MNDSQHHRGPDEGSLHVEPGLGFGHRRLSIIDVATGQQPLFNEDGSVVVVFNGEIYNFQDLIPELEAAWPPLPYQERHRGHRPRLGAMGRALCRALSRHVRLRAVGPQPPDAVPGARPAGRQAVALRGADDGTLLFGSEQKSLLAYRDGRGGGLRRDIDPAAVEEYFAYGYVPEPRTIFKGARKLPPGHTFALRRGEPVGEPREFWDVRFTLDRQIRRRLAKSCVIASTNRCACA